jgi:hypothetical protein
MKQTTILLYCFTRNTREEVNPEEVERQKSFTPMYIYHQVILWCPFFRIAKQELRFVPDPTEVARIIEPLQFFR